MFRHRPTCRDATPSELVNPAIGSYQGRRCAPTLRYETKALRANHTASPALHPTQQVKSSRSLPIAFRATQNSSWRLRIRFRATQNSSWRLRTHFPATRNSFPSLLLAFRPTLNEVKAAAPMNTFPALPPRTTSPQLDFPCPFPLDRASPKSRPPNDEIFHFLLPHPDSSTKNGGRI